MAGNETYANFRALRMIVLLNPLTHFTIAGLLAVAPEMPAAALYRRVLVASCLFFLMPPLAWLADRISSRGELASARITRARDDGCVESGVRTGATEPRSGSGG